MLVLHQSTSIRAGSDFFFPPYNYDTPALPPMSAHPTGGSGVRGVGDVETLSVVWRGGHRSDCAEPQVRRAEPVRRVGFLAPTTGGKGGRSAGGTEEGEGV